MKFITHSGYRLCKVSSPYFTFDLGGRPMMEISA